MVTRSYDNTADILITPESSYPVFRRSDNLINSPKLSLGNSGTAHRQTFMGQPELHTIDKAPSK